MKRVTVNQLQHFQIMCTVFEEVISDYKTEQCKECLTKFTNRVHAKMFSKGRLETSENVRKTMREVFKVG